MRTLPRQVWDAPVEWRRRGLENRFGFAFATSMSGRPFFARRVRFFFCRQRMVSLLFLVMQSI